MKTSCRSAWGGWPPKTRHCASSRTRRRTRSCSGAWARPMPVSFSTHWLIGTASPWTRSSCGCRCGKPSAARRKAMAATSSSPAGTASTRCATSRWSRCRRAPASSSSTRWWAERCREISSPAWRRVSARRWKRACRRVIRWSTSGSRCSTARRTASTLRISPSRWRVGWRCGRRRPRPRCPCSSRSTRSRCWYPTISSAR